MQTKYGYAEAYSQWDRGTEEKAMFRNETTVTKVQNTVVTYSSDASLEQNWQSITVII